MALPLLSPAKVDLQTDVSEVAGLKFSTARVRTKSDKRIFPTGIP